MGNSLQLALTYTQSYTRTQSHVCVSTLVFRKSFSFINRTKRAQRLSLTPVQHTCSVTLPVTCCNPTSCKPPSRCLSHTSTCTLPLSSLPPSLFASLILCPLLFSPVPIQLAEQQHGEPGEPCDVRQPLQLGERLLVDRAHPLTLLPTQLNL